VQLDGDAPGRLLLPEAESIPIALTLNELLTNAVKHGGQQPVRCLLAGRDDGLCVQVRNQGRLPEGFSLAQVRGGVSGLGLVRALLPRRSAQFTLQSVGDEVVAEVLLKPPSVQRDEP
jgi:two-component sensor histidine kinase